VLLASGALVGVGAGAADAATLTVNTTVDPGYGTCDAYECTLREAIVASNASESVADTIGFDIPGPGPHLIQLSDSDLPPIEDPVTIDGTSEPDYEGVPVVELNGYGGRSYGLVLEAGNSVVRGLIVSGFAQIGIAVWSSDNQILSNYIGTNPDGIDGNGNGLAGVMVLGDDNVIGSPDSGNLISGNGPDPAGYGIWIAGDDDDDAAADDDDDESTGNSVQDNLIGVAADGTSDLGNQLSGILLEGDADDNVIGGASPSTEGNVIAFNGLHGVEFSSEACCPDGNAILGNAIHSNANDGIHHGNFGNNLRPAPTLTSVTVSVAETTIEGELSGSTPSATHRLEFFTNSLGCDPSGFGEGQSFLGTASVITDESGNTGPFAVTLPTAIPVGEVVTSTATDPNDDTSEFSNCVEAADSGGSADLEVAQVDLPDPFTEGAQVAYLISVTNNGPDAATNVMLVDDIPAETDWVSSAPSQGTCQTLINDVMCDLGTIEEGGSASVTIVVRGTGPPGEITNEVTVSSDQNDPGPGPNNSLETTTVQPLEQDDAAGYFDGSGGVISNGTMATPDNTTIVTVVVPAGVVGVVTITEEPGSPSDTPGGEPFGDLVLLDMPPATPEDPYLFVFGIDASVIPAGTRLSQIGIWIDEVLTLRCTRPSDVAEPDPCLKRKTFVRTETPDILDLQTWVFASADPKGRHGVL
jgi:uncharacterized repeat protein (TIGR01451 family)/CSLREA domain-containing protein